MRANPDVVLRCFEVAARVYEGSQREAPVLDFAKELYREVAEMCWGSSE